jgi:hypothetical protein
MKFYNNTEKLHYYAEKIEKLNDTLCPELTQTFYNLANDNHNKYPTYELPQLADLAEKTCSAYCLTDPERALYPEFQTAIKNFIAHAKDKTIHENSFELLKEKAEEVIDAF